MFNKLILIIILISCASLTRAQQYELDGDLMVGSIRFPYHLVFSESGGVIKGSAVYAFFGVVHQAKISGTMDTATGSFAFRESDIICSHDEGQAHIMWMIAGTFRKERQHVWLRANANPRSSGFREGGGHSLDNSIVILDADASLTRRLLGKDAPPPLLTRLPDAMRTDSLEVTPLGGLTSAEPLQLNWPARQLHLEIYDDKEEDGDQVSLLLNGATEIRELALTKKGEILDLELQPGINTLTIYAENDGTLPPNTSRIVLSDGKHSYAVQTIINAYKEAKIELTVPE